MSRPRTIDQEAILDAAETVVARDGAARLTLDAVAREAGISKASVIYDYKSKQALVRAVVERRVAEEQARLRLAIADCGSSPDAAIRGRIAAAAERLPDQAEAVAFNLCSALAQDAELRSLLNKSFRDDLSGIVDGSPDPRAARLAFLAVEGLRSLEFLGILRWPEAERTQILRDIEALLPGPDGTTRPVTGQPDPPTVDRKH